MDWNKIAWMVASALVSGLLTSLISLFYHHRAEIKRRKIAVFESLMRSRFSLASRESVESLNLVDVVFYDSIAIRSAYHSFLEETNKPEDGHSKVGDKYLMLLEKIADELGMHKINWESIKQYYFPVGLAEQMRDEAVLRKLQIQSAAQTIRGVQS